MFYNGGDTCTDVSLDTLWYIVCEVTHRHDIMKSLRLLIADANQPSICCCCRRDVDGRPSWRRPGSALDPEEAALTTHINHALYASKVSAANTTPNNGGH